MPNKQVTVRFEGEAVIYTECDTDEKANQLAIETVQDALQVAFEPPDGWVDPELGAMNGIDLMADSVVEIANNSLSVDIPVMEMIDFLHERIIDAINDGLNHSIVYYDLTPEQFKQAVVIALRDVRDDHIAKP